MRANVDFVLIDNAKRKVILFFLLSNTPWTEEVLPDENGVAAFQREVAPYLLQYFMPSSTRKIRSWKFMYFESVLLSVISTWAVYRSAVYVQIQAAFLNNTHFSFLTVPMRLEWMQREENVNVPIPGNGGSIANVHMKLVNF